MGGMSDKRTSGGPNKSLGETGPNTSGNLNKEFSRTRREQFCEVLATTAQGRRIEACREIGVHRATVGRRLAEDPEFASAYEEAMERFRESLQKEATRRAVEGTHKPVYFKGQRAKDVDEDGNEVNASIREYDTPLLILLLKRHCPEFKDKQIVENRNVNVDMGMADLEKMTPDQRDLIRKLIEMEGDKNEEGGSQ